MQIERVKWMWSGAPFGAQLTPDQSTSYSCTSSRFSRRKTTLHWFYKWMEKNFENGGNLRVRKRRLIWFKTASDTLDTSSFEASSQDRVGGAMAEKIRKFKRKMESITNGKKKEKVASRDLGEYKTGWGQTDPKRRPNATAWPKKMKIFARRSKRRRQFILEDEGKAYPQG